MEVDISSEELFQFESTSSVGITRALKSRSVAYLKPVLGLILPKALTEICEKRPADPIEYLARYLYQWADCELYYYEKAIFAKELQLLALQLDKETSRRLARIEALKKETNALKYLMSNERALVKFLSHKTLSKASLSLQKKDSAFEAEMQAWARDNAADEYGLPKSAISSDGRRSSTLLGGRHRTYSEAEERRRRQLMSGAAGLDDFDFSTASKDDRRRRKKQSGPDDYDSGGTSRRSSSKRRLRKFGTRDQDDEYGGHMTGSAMARKLSRQRRMSRSQKEKTTDESEDELYDEFADAYGADAKLKYGFEVTPVRCTWYLAEPNILVCVHPVLGEIRATIPTRTPLSNTPEWWERNEYKFEVMYDHEIYSHPKPHFDDDVYQDVMIVWEDEDVKEEEYIKEGGENDPEDA